MLGLLVKLIHVDDDNDDGIIFIWSIFQSDGGGAYSSFVNSFGGKNLF